jgi:hypothetical protein
LQPEIDETDEYEDRSYPVTRSRANSNTVLLVPHYDSSVPEEFSVDDGSSASVPVLQLSALQDRDASFDDKDEDEEDEQLCIATRSRAVRNIYYVHFWLIRFDSVRATSKSKYLTPLTHNRILAQACSPHISA